MSIGRDTPTPEQLAEAKEITETLATANPLAPTLAGMDEMQSTLEEMGQHIAALSPVEEEMLPSKAAPSLQPDKDADTDDDIPALAIELGADKPAPVMPPSTATSSSNSTNEVRPSSGTNAASNLPPTPGTASPDTATPPPVMSITEDNTPEPSNTPPSGDTSTNANTSMPQEKLGKIDFVKQKFFLLRHLDNYKNRLNYFEAICGQIDSSAHSRELSRINDMIRTTRSMHDKLNALTDLSEKEQADIKALVARCATVLTTLENMGKQNHLLSYGKEAPIVFENYEKAQEALAEYLKAPSATASENYMGNISSAYNGTSSTGPSYQKYERKQTIDIAHPQDEEAVNHYFEVENNTHTTLKTAAINYNKVTEYEKNNKTGEKGKIEEYRSELYMDAATKASLDNDKADLGITMLTSTLPNMSVMTWARNVLNTFLADKRAIPPLQFNFPYLPKTCMIALVLQAKVQGIEVSAYSNFGGQFKVSDAKKCHVTAYRDALNKLRTAPSKEPGDYAVEDVKKWGFKP